MALCRLGNRINSATGKASYTYDGYGRRTKISYTDGRSKIQIYSPEGQLLYATESGGGKANVTTNYIYLHKSQIAEIKR